MAPIPEAVLYAPTLLVSLSVMIFVVWICADGDSEKKKTKPMKKVEHFSNIQSSKPNTSDPRGNTLAAKLRSPVPVSSPQTAQGDSKKSGGTHKLGFDAGQILREYFKDDKSLARLTVDEKRLNLTEIIGQGNFGLVYKGSLLDKNMANPYPVAVKTVQGAGCRRQDVEEFVRESARMRGFSHQHVLCMTGVVTKDNKPFVILPYMENGDLKSYVADRHRKLTLEDLGRFGYHVAQGMSYLSSNKFIHRDLAARNCMVSGDMTVKVADFGLSRDLYQADYYKMSNLDTPLPIRWVALECILTSKFSTKSDVWSFGVLLWELFTRGRTPYPNLTNNMEVVRYLKSGQRLEIPSYVPSSLVHVVRICWESKPDDRPDFAKLCNLIHAVLEDDGDYVRPVKSR